MPTRDGNVGSAKLLRLRSSAEPNSNRTLLARATLLPALLLASLVAAAATHAVQQDADAWPQLLGPRRDGTAPATRVAVWPEGGPQVLWRRDVGEGFAGPSVAAEQLFLFHRVADEELLESLDLATGATNWRTSYATDYRDDFGFDEGPRATPTVAQGRVFTLGAQGELQAVDLTTGRRLWSVGTHARFGVRKGFFGAASAPLVDGDHVMVNVGGPGAGIVAFDAASGEVLWAATDHEASYSAPVTADLGGRHSALFFTRNGLVEIDPASGQVRADYPWRSRSRSSVNAASPLVIGDRVYLSASYGTGAVLLERSAVGFMPVWSSDDVLTNHYATSIHHRGYLYGFHGRQEYGQSLRAVELSTGKVAWEVERFGAGTLLLVGDRLLILRERGELVLAEATPEAFRPLASARILDGTTRAYPALANNLLFARNGSELIAVELPSPPSS